MLGTKVKLGLAVLVVAVAAFLLLRRAPNPAQRPMAPESAHGMGMDHAMGAVLAMQRAPEGKTPCESAYNAFKASYDFSQEHDVKAVVLRLAPHDEFLARCAELPPPVQACLVPSYITHHREECARSRASQEMLKPMVELLQRTEPVDQNESPPIVPAGSAPAP